METTEHPCFLETQDESLPSVSNDNSGGLNVDTCVDYSEKCEELRAAVKPLQEWLIKHYHLHTKAIVQVDRVDIAEDILGITLDF